MKLCSISLYFLLITVTLIHSKNVHLAKFQTNTQPTDSVQKTLQEDLETLRLLDQSMSMPIKAAKNPNRKLKKTLLNENKSAFKTRKSQVISQMNLRPKHAVINHKLTRNLSKKSPTAKKLARKLEVDEDELDALVNATNASDQKSLLISYHRISNYKNGKIAFGSQKHNGRLYRSN